MRRAPRGEVLIRVDVLVCEMARSKAVLSLLLLATVTGLSESSYESSDSPVITSTNLPEIVVNPGENFTITCEGHMPVIWNYPNISDNEPRTHVTQKNGKYVSSIQLINITYKDVGYYYCLLDNNSEKNSSVYVYVNDTENLLTHSDSPFEPIHGMQYEEIIIPCKPTHPEVNVTLCRNGDEKLNIGDNDYFGVIKYNQKVGFILENAQVRHNGYYICCTLPDGICSQECPQVYSLEVLKHADSVARPAIDDTGLQHVNVGDNVTMECTVTVPLSTKYKLEWIIPNMSDRIIVGDVVLVPPMMPGHHLSTGKKTLTLTILNAELEDMGNYMCKVTDHANNHNSETLYLKIFERNEAYINLTLNGNKTVAEVQEGQDFRWVINVEAHPKPYFTWFKNCTEINNSSRIFVTSHPDMKLSILEIKRVTIQDSGDYEIEATNRNFSKVLKLKLIVLGKPHVYMPSYPLKFFHGSSQQVNCTILGRPSPNVTWFFQPDGSKKKKISTEHFKNYVVSEEEGYKTVSALELKATVSGTLECLAANKYGSDTEKTQIIIVGVEDIYEPVWFAYQCLESFLLPIYTNKIGLNSETQSRSSETAGAETVDAAEETENCNSLAGTSTPASTVSSPCTSNFKEKSRRRTASNIAEQQMATAFGQLTNVLSQRQSCANAEEDECDLYGKQLAKKMRELPEDDRKLMMYEIDGLFIKRIKQRLFSRETPSP